MKTSNRMKALKMTTSENQPPLSRSTKSWNGRWSDGKTAASHDVEIKLQNENLIFEFKDQPGTSPHIWPYDQIKSPHPVHHDDKSVLLTSSQNTDERLFINEPNFAKRILDQAPNITHNAHTWSLLKWPMAIAASIVIFWGLTYIDVISPANNIARILPDSTRTTLGNGVINTLKGKRKFCESGEGKAALNKLITRLYPATPDTINFDIKVADLKMVNAFAAPGDKIIVSGKLIKQANSPDELAGVIAHEMGHSIERHPEAGIVRALGLMTLLQIMTAGESSSFGDIAFLLVQSGYSRSAEQQADDHAARILQKVNIDTRPLAGFFKRLTNKKKSKNTKNKDKDTNFFSWINTHPASKDRIDFFNRTSRPTTPPIMSDQEWQALKNICPIVKETKKTKIKQASSRKKTATPE